MTAPWHLSLNSLWVRMSIAFGAVVVLGVTITALISILVVTGELAASDYTEGFRIPDGPLDNLARYYRINQSWDGVESVLSGIQSLYVRNDRSSVTFALTGDDDYVYYSSHPHNIEDWTGIAFDEMLPIMVDGINRGTLHILGLYRGTGLLNNDLERLVGSWLSENLLSTALVGAIVGILAGILVSRGLTAPLSRLADAAQAIGSRDLSQRVEVDGSTEVKQLARAFNQMATDLETGEKLRRNLVADVAHELRTPLTVLQGNLRAILDDVYPLSKVEVVKLYDQTRLLSRLVNDLHELSQAEARKLPFEKEWIDLDEIIKGVTATFGPLAEAELVTLEVELTPPLSVYGDVARLSQVMQNLLSNALQHTPAGGVIRLRGVCERDQIRLEISDTGVGISPEHLPYIFDRFYRADRSRSRNTGGTGLGLAICKAIVEGHGGTITASSDGIAGHGTTFTIVLPLDTD